MGLDAQVYCDCYEKGKVRRPPPQPELVYVDENGQVCLRWDAPGADQNAFFEWQKDACDHGPMGELVWHRLGNIARIAFIRSVLAESPERFHVLLAKVVYSGTHAGDWLAHTDLEPLASELRSLSTVHVRDDVHEAIVREFDRQMSELVDAAIRLQKPIAF